MDWVKVLGHTKAESLAARRPLVSRHEIMMGPEEFNTLAEVHLARRGAPQGGLCLRTADRLQRGTASKKSPANNDFARALEIRAAAPILR